MPETFDHGAEYDRTDLSYAIAEHSGLSPVQAMIVLQALAAVLADALIQGGGRVEVRDLGVFRLEKRAPRKGVTPDGDEWQKPYERQEIVFHASPGINETVTARTGIECYSA